ncbi:MAG TPA: bifunctional hydroxymethylpyrimidine kinase/phosphomethylpyrimidine kinase [Candidatus Gemmiger excrementipullorum]|uniref:pyridoxal kinase n=1 Tax=Candidatus Gemmiger excrementipullorum TaxID=2838610 RepID=A0A9D1Y0R8_9FIRM|nr:bifunctional hydroxymethylpyrimidine kinase/phosphomethylpyrimidine kinase [Candidatus Gemmiger excrementipullorum]
MSNAPKTVLAIHDLPGFGRAALSVIVPVLSCLGVQAVALPTAVLSTHTGGLGTPAKLSNPGYGPAALAHYQRLGLRFDCIYAGYLADPNQAKLVEQAFELWPQAYKVVDPVLGDAGRLYRGVGAEMVPAMYDLCRKADLILPNGTEAALLLGDPLPGVGSAEQAAAQAARLTRIAPQVVVTGVTGLADGRCIGCVGAARGGQGYLVKTPLIPRLYHGTGDIFGAVLVGRILQGNVPQAAVQAAAAFVAECIRQTPEGADERLGVWLEAALPKLMTQ